MVKTNRFPIRNLEEHQRYALAHLEDNNCLAFLFINWRNNKAGSAIWITFKDYSEIEYIVLSDGVKSLKPDNFTDEWFLKRVSGGWIVPDNHRLKYLL